MDISFAQNQLLFGWDDTPGIVSLELEGDRHIRVYRRVGKNVLSELQTLRPLLWLAEADLLKHFRGQVELVPLTGSLTYRVLALFNSWKEMNAARKYLQKLTATGPSDRADCIFLSDPVHQHLLLTGQTSFRGLSFADLVRLQLDIETYSAPGFEFPNPQRESDRIIAIALSDSSGWETVLRGTETSEPEMLRSLNEIIRLRDPDVIEGHNIFKFDLDYIKARAERHGIPLSWGRDWSVATRYDSRLMLAERIIDYSKWQIHGRHVVDTWILSQFYDISSRELDNLGLKEMAKHFDLADKERTYVEGSQISRIYEEDPAVLFRYALDDVRETRALSALLSRSYLIQDQIFPYAYQNVIVRGNATKINALFVREYLRQRHSLPAPPRQSQAFAGGYTNIFVEGVVKHVVHCDVTSLYPSIMLARALKPGGDALDIFLPLLRDLRTFRVEAKRLSKIGQSSEERSYLQALQATFKILINSFYGYLGTSFSNFADFQVAGEITETGRQILKQMIEWLEQQGCQVIEIDTDGIYFVPPVEREGPEAERQLIAELAQSLPKGIEVECDGRYQAMLSYKMKNYALLDYEGKLVVKGSGLRSRGLERFQREFLKELIHILLRDEPEKAQPLYLQYLAKLDRHEFDISLLCKTETLSESLSSYKQKVREKKRNASALYELALKSEKDYQPGDQISYYVTGAGKDVRAFDNCKLASQWDSAHPDENVAHYKGKLKELFEKFKPFLPPSERPQQQELHFEFTETPLE